MASDKAIAAVSEAIRRILADDAAGSDYSIVQIEVYQGGNLQSPMTEGLSVYLYRVSVNASRRSARSHLGPDGAHVAPPLCLDLHYLVTAWAEEALKQHLLLGWAALKLNNTPVLPAELLNQCASGPNVFAPAEQVQVVGEPLSLQDEVTIWEAASGTQQPSVGYVASVDISEP